jgi:ATP-dependent DNA helicase RecG
VDIWIPKHSIIKPKHINTINFDDIDFTKYDRNPLPHQLPAIKKLLEYDRFILADDMGLGKMEFVDNKIFTPFGRKKIGDLKIGDKAIDSNGKSITVTGVFPHGIKDLYRVTFNDNYSVLVGDEHLWTVSSSCSGENNKNRENRYITLSTKQMLDKDLILKQKGTGWNEKRSYIFSTYYKNKNGSSKWQIPIVKPIEFENNYELPINPYLLGLILGDGHINFKVVKFTTHKDDFDEIFNDFAIIEKKPNPKRPNVRRGVIHCDSINKLNLQHTRSHNKFIPETYKYSTINDRLEILRGLMDTDGYCIKSKHGQFAGTEFCTVDRKSVV